VKKQLVKRKKKPHAKLRRKKMLKKELRRKRN